MEGNNILPQTHGSPSKNLLMIAVIIHSKPHGIKPNLSTVKKHFFITSGSKSSPALVKIIVNAAFLKITKDLVIF